MYTDQRPHALFAGGRHGLHPGRAAAALARADASRVLLVAAALVGIGLVGVPSRSPRAWRGWRRAGGTGWRSRCSRSAAMPARRSGRCWRRSSWCRAGRAASPGSRWRRCWRCVVLAQVGRWYRAHRRSARAGRRPRRRHRPLPPRRGRRRDRDPAGADLLQVLLPGQPDQLLHVLPDPPVPRVGAERAAPPVRVPGRGGGGHRSSGGPIGDRIGRKYVIWVSILGVLPFTLVLPYADLFWTAC